MGVNVSNLLLGPGTLYSGAFGTSEPADSAIGSAPGGSWTDVGGTMGGVTLTIDQSFKELQVDQVVETVGRRLTAREMQIKTNLAEATLENFKLVANGSASITTGSGYKYFEPTNDTSATQPTYVALLFDGFAPSSSGAKTRRVIARRCLSTDKVELAYSKDDQTVLTVTFAAHFVSNSVPAYKIIDQV